MDQEKDKIKDCVRTRDGRVSVEKLTGCIGIIIFATMTVLIGLEILSKDINSIVATGLTGSFGILGANSFGKNH